MNLTQQRLAAISILEALGMVEKRLLDFADTDFRYDENREVVLFNGTTSGQDVHCAISREAIEDLAERKFRARQFESDGTILIRTLDLSRALNDSLLRPYTAEHRHYENRAFQIGGKDR